MTNLNRRLERLEQATLQEDRAPEDLAYNLWRAYGDPDSSPPDWSNVTAKEFEQMLSDAIRRAYGEYRPETKRPGTAFRIQL